jgi:alkyl sulfatase BDS1-like metallo-beta-lactamase superfamily hydrolase
LTKKNQNPLRLVLTVLPGIHCAVGYGLANCMLIEGDDGNIIIDTLESRESAIEVKKDFQIISSKPIVAIIYTHNHADHIFGAQVFAEENRDNIKIYAHSKTLEILDKIMSFVQPITFQRAARQFGTFLTKEIGHINNGIGLFLNYNQNSTQAFLPPTDTFDTDSKKLTIAGREFILYHAPGETDDQIVIYMPKERVLFAADNIYKSFPNIYAIRGTTARDARQWVSSLDLMRNLKAEYLIPSHTRPIKGEEDIYDIITQYRDAIQFVHDQTVRFMNQGLTPDEIIGNKLIQLPKNLREHPYLQEFYGTVNW